MDWEAVGAIGEIIGAGAVVLTLIYLSLQMRQNTAAVQSTRRENQFQTLSAWYQQLNVPNGAEVWLAGAMHYEDLSPEDRVRFHSMAVQIMLSYEQGRQFVRQGLYSQSDLEPQEQWTVAFVNTPGGKVWFKESEHYWNPELKAHLEKLSVDYKQTNVDPLLHSI